ncbi:MAG: DEAD/DEAH box helicase [Anaerolineales bacterium]|nr:DEAD/DEAH box helicase [Anaerolineales bacterium]
MSAHIISSDDMTALALKSRLPRTWSPFFARHGTFTPAQLAAIPPLLDGQNVMLCAPTASGKTEAALAPFIERHLPPARTTQQLTLLYLLPTRALIADIANRLAAPLERLRVSLAVKTHDLDDFDPRRPADLLLTTPESLDALLATKARSLMHVRGVVLDELHVLDGDARGDQLRAVLARLRQVVTFAAQQGDDAAGHIQYVALSATLADPATVAARYFPNPQVVITPGGRDRRIELLPMAPDSAAALLEHLATFQGSDWRKALVFCNTRAEVEAYAMAVRGAHTPFGYAVYVHYSNLERRRRQEIEQQFAQAGAAICFASSTLELGIDIGSIDVAILIGAPGSAAAFTQRIGAQPPPADDPRHVLLPHSTGGMLLRALMDAAGPTLTSAPFRPSVAVQQIFSLLLQSPTGALRFAAADRPVFGSARRRRSRGAPGAAARASLSYHRTRRRMAGRRAAQAAGGSTGIRPCAVEPVQQHPEPAGHPENPRSEQPTSCCHRGSAVARPRSADAGRTCAGCDLVRRRGAVGDAWQRARRTGEAPLSLGAPIVELRPGAGFAARPGAGAGGRALGRNAYRLAALSLVGRCLRPGAARSAAPTDSSECSVAAGAGSAAV